MTLDIPNAPGSYLLWLQLSRKRRLIIGKLGEHLFLPGYYAYTGSAFGPGGLKARLGHHLKKTECTHWHIDYLKNISSSREIWFSTTPDNMEHLWANTLSQLPNAIMPVNGFGASDCSCPTHLLYFPEQPDSSLLQNLSPGISATRIIL